jgi:hypothetical protein
MEMTPPEAGGAPPVVARMSFLGAEEVRDMRFVPPQQLAAFPRRTAGQVRALEQMAGSRFHLRVRVGQDGYLSFIPLGSPTGCACTYRAGVRDAGKVEELYRFAAEPMGAIAPAAVELDLAKYAGREIELLFQVDGPTPLPPGQPVPTVLWGSPAVYFRQAAERAARQEGKLNVLFLGLDTLRADAVGAWSGREPSLTPAMDRLAAQSDVWLEAYSTFNATNPSFVSMMTGLYGKNHGVYDLQTPLPPSHVTLAEHLHKAGYETLAVIAARHLGDHNSGLGQGFDQVVRADEHYAGELSVDTALEWIGPRLSGPKPFFAWVHLFDPHTPHTPPQPYAIGFRPESALGLSPVRTWIPFRQPGPRAFTEPVLGGQRDGLSRPPSRTAARLPGEPGGAGRHAGRAGGGPRREPRRARHHLPARRAPRHHHARADDDPLAPRGPTEAGGAADRGAGADDRPLPDDPGRGGAPGAGAGRRGPADADG